MQRRCWAYACNTPVACARSGGCALRGAEEVSVSAKYRSAGATHAQPDRICFMSRHLFFSQLVNVHLFADDSNIEAARKSPSQFSRWREAAMRFTLGKQADACIFRRSVSTGGHFVAVATRLTYIRACVCREAGGESLTHASILFFWGGSACNSAPPQTGRSSGHRLQTATTERLRRRRARARAGRARNPKAQTAR